MNRYLNAQNISGQNEKRRYSTTLFPNVDVSSSDVYIRTTSIERLDKLAQKFYNDATAWPVIAAANSIKKGTLVIPNNTRLRIPAISEVQEYINNLNFNR